METNPRFHELAVASICRRPVQSISRDRYAWLAGLARPRLGALRVRDITANHVRELLTETEHLAPCSRASLVSFIRSVLHEVGNPAADNVHVRVPDTDMVTLNKVDTHLVRGALEYQNSPAADLAILVLETGLRVGEALALQPSDWDAAALQLVVRKSKSGKARRVDATDYLATRLNARGLPGRTYRKAVQRALHVACDAVGAPRIRVHDLRHGRITHLLLAGVPVLYVSHQAGHSSVNFTMNRYGHLAVAPEAQRREWANC